MVLRSTASRDGGYNSKAHTKRFSPIIISLYSKLIAALNILELLSKLSHPQCREPQKTKYIFCQFLVTYSASFLDQLSVFENLLSFAFNIYTSRQTV